jgi:hypothetical protein
MKDSPAPVDFFKPAPNPIRGGMNRFQLHSNNLIHPFFFAKLSISTQLDYLIIKETFDIYWALYYQLLLQVSGC